MYVGDDALERRNGVAGRGADVLPDRLHERPGRRGRNPGGAIAWCKALGINLFSSFSPSSSSLGTSFGGLAQHLAKICNLPPKNAVAITSKRQRKRPCGVRRLLHHAEGAAGLRRTTRPCLPRCVAEPYPGLVFRFFGVCLASYLV